MLLKSFFNKFNSSLQDYSDNINKKIKNIIISVILSNVLYVSLNLSVLKGKNVFILLGGYNELLKYLLLYWLKFNFKGFVNMLTDLFILVKVAD